MRQSMLLSPTPQEYAGRRTPGALERGASTDAQAGVAFLKLHTAPQHNAPCWSFCFFFLFYFPSYDSTQNTAGVPQERTPLQIVCAPAPVRIFRRPSSIKRRPESLESKHRSSKSL